MTIKATLQDDMKSAMRARDQKRLDAIRLILAAVKQIEVDERIEVDDSRCLTILDKLAKQRRESISQYLAAKRQDLVDQEQFELDLILAYLPTPLTDAEIDALVIAAMKESGASTMQEMGKVMTILKPQVQGRADMSQISAKIKAQLSA